MMQKNGLTNPKRLQPSCHVPHPSSRSVFTSKDTLLRHLPGCWWGALSYDFMRLSCTSLMLLRRKPQILQRKWAHAFCKCSQTKKSRTGLKYSWNVWSCCALNSWTGNGRIHSADWHVSTCFYIANDITTGFIDTCDVMSGIFSASRMLAFAAFAGQQNKNLGDWNT